VPAPPARAPIDTAPAVRSAAVSGGPDTTPIEGLPLRPYGCRRGHQRPVPIGHHPQLGLVPSRSSVVIGALAWGLALFLVARFLPAWALEVALLASLAGLVVDVAVQTAAGHRGWCWVRRVGRWYFGPIGALLDPFDSDA
jgi:hypothetical protein